MFRQLTLLRESLWPLYESPPARRTRKRRGKHKPKCAPPTYVSIPTYDGHNLRYDIPRTVPVKTHGELLATLPERYLDGRYDRNRLLRYYDTKHGEQVVLPFRGGGPWGLQQMTQVCKFRRGRIDEGIAAQRRAEERENRVPLRGRRPYRGRRR